jgi:hypothetical protein
LDEGVIDIRSYLERSQSANGRAFSVWGGEGERARFALPVWRALFLVEGDRGGIFYWRGKGSEETMPFFVLDLGEEPARTRFDPPPPDLGASIEAPAQAFRRNGDLLVFLGEERGNRWFLEVGGGGERKPLAGKKREELLFLAGECAGLLFFRAFAGSEDEGGGGGT